jgi:hypothetical protein
MKGQAQLLGKCRYKLCVGLRFRAAPPMVEVRDLEHQSTRHPERVQRSSQEDRVRATGDGDKRGLAGGQRRILGEETLDAADERVSRA